MHRKELYELFIPRGHVLFSEDDLLRELLADERFVVTGKEASPRVSVRDADGHHRRQQQPG